MKPVFCLFAAALFTCGAIAQGKAPVDSSETSQGTSALDASLFYQLLLGELQVQQGEPGAGFSLLLDAARKTGSPDLYQRAVSIALQSRAGEAALQAARAWVQAHPSSREANRTNLQILLALNRVSEVGDLLAKELAATPGSERSAVIAGIPRGFMRVPDKKLAVTVVEGALADALRQPETGAAAWVALGRMRAMAGDPPGALDAARKAVTFDPRNEDAALLALELMSPGLPLAEPLVKGVIEKNPTQDLRMGYARALLDTSRTNDALLQLQRLTEEQPGFSPGWLTLGLLQLQENLLQPAEGSLKRFLESPPVHSPDKLQRARTEALLGLAQIAEKRKDFAAAQQWLNQIDDPDERITLVSRRASLLARQGKLDEARAMIQAWPTRNPAEARSKLLAEVHLLRENGQAATAYELLTQAIQSQPTDTDLLYDQALLAEKLRDYENMERLLRKLISLKPDYHHAYNALGYSFAERNVRLAEARTLINKALEFAPDDPMIRDSLGWVEFRTGNMKKALEILQSAYKARPDADIAAHLGEVLWVMGQRDQAVAVWREGLRLSSDSETLTETLKRFQVSP